MPDAAPTSTASWSDAAAGADAESPSSHSQDAAYEEAYLGDIDKEPVVFWLRREGAAITGRYFYEKEGVDRGLQGAVDASAVVSLNVDGGAEVFTGTFADVDHLSGICTHGKRRVSYHVARASAPSVESEHPVSLLHKHAREERSQGTQDHCKVDVEYLEVVGGLLPAVTPNVNALLRPRPFELRCEPDALATGSAQVSLNERGVLAVSTSAGHIPLHCAWPSLCWANDGGPRTLNLLVPSGQNLPLHEVLTPAAVANLPQLVGPALAATVTTRSKPTVEDETEIQSLANYFRQDNDGVAYLLEPSGVRFYALGASGAVRVLRSEGAFVDYKSLTDHGALTASGPVTRVWARAAGSKPIAK